jgi:archaellum component FlaC
MYPNINIKNELVKSCIRQLIERSKFSIERTQNAIKDINSFYNEKMSDAFISGYATATLKESLKWFTSINEVSEEAHGNTFSFDDSFVFFEDNKYENCLNDCFDGLKLAKKSGVNGSLDSVEFIRGSINDLTKALEVLGHEKEALNIRNYVNELIEVRYGVGPNGI